MPWSRLTGLVAGLAVAVGLWSAAVAYGAPAHDRAWELVTSGAGNGVGIIQNRAWTADGDGVAFISLGPLPGGPSGELLSHMASFGGPDGWERKGVGSTFTSPTFQLFGSRAMAVNEDLSSWIWGSYNALVPGAPSTPDMGIYRLEDDGTPTLLGDIGPANPFESLSFYVASSDTQRLGFHSRQPLEPPDAGRTVGRAAYELAGTTRRLVGVGDDGNPLSECGSVIGSGDLTPSLSPKAMSRDGARIYFTSPDPATTECPADLERVYLREDGSETTEVSASQCTRADCGPPADARFLTATPDGSQAFIVTEQQLTDDDTGSGADLYRYDVASGDLTRLSTAPAEAFVESTAAAVSDDGERVYFVAFGVLAPGGAQGEPNIYLWEDGQIHYAGQLLGSSLLGAGITPDGGRLLYTTIFSLLPSDTDGEMDTYLYDAESDALQQLSLGAQGEGNGPFDVISTEFTTEPMPGHTYRTLSPDGEHAFFVTPEALTPDDVNGEEADVYEWVDGSVGLVTSGTGSANRVEFGGVSPDGRSAFFMTDQSLLAADGDQGDRDVYVARIGGGFPDVAPPSCDGDACQGPLQEGKQQPAPGSGTQPFDGGRPANPAQGAFGFEPIGPRQRRQLARSGRTALTLDVPSAGRVLLLARARVDGRLRIVGRGKAVARDEGKLRVALRLLRNGRDALAADGTLRLRLRAFHAHVPGVRKTVMTLKEGS